MNSGGHNSTYNRHQIIITSKGQNLLVWFPEISLSILVHTMSCLEALEPDTGVTSNHHFLAVCLLRPPDNTALRKFSSIPPKQRSQLNTPRADPELSTFPNRDVFTLPSRHVSQTRLKQTPGTTPPQVQTCQCTAVRPDKFYLKG